MTDDKLLVEYDDGGACSNECWQCAAVW